jgi:predicted TIM-barrel fold metal-dependent hydrolase
MTASGTTAMDIVAYDAHQHVDFGEYSVGAPEAVDWLRGDLDHRIQMMDDANIACAVVMPSYDYDKRFGLESTARVIEGLRTYQQWAPDRFPWLGCTVEPQHYEGAVEQLDQTLASGAFRIASWHNRYQGSSVDAPVMFQFAEVVAASHDCVLYLHATGNLDHEEAWRIARLVRAFPQVRFVVLDSLMTNTSIQMLGDLLAEVDNAWIDTAGAIAFVHLVKQLANRVGWGRVLFGSDYYGVGRGGTAELMRHQLALCDMSADDVERVFQRNIEDVLGAPPTPARETRRP